VGFEVRLRCRQVDRLKTFKIIFVSYKKDGRKEFGAGRRI